MTGAPRDLFLSLEQVAAMGLPNPLQGAWREHEGRDEAQFAAMYEYPVHEWPRGWFRARWPGPPWVSMTTRRVWWIVQRDGWQCSYCPKILSPRTATTDHDVPERRGGPDTLDNVCLACESCNSRKSSRTRAEYLAVLGATT